MDNQQSNTDPKVHLTLTILQARAMGEALELYMRLGLGQVHMVSEMVADGSIPLKAESLRACPYLT